MSHTQDDCFCSVVWYLDDHVSAPSGPTHCFTRDYCAWFIVLRTRRATPRAKYSLQDFILVSDYSRSIKCTSAIGWMVLPRTLKTRREPRGKWCDCLELSEEGTDGLTTGFEVGNS
jgi:hypothetical protein